METPRFLSGKLLLAMPGIGDPRFERAVIAMCVHDENGAVGIGIGRATSLVTVTRRAYLAPSPSKELIP